jgi:hypothetical protein
MYIKRLVLSFVMFICACIAQRTYAVHNDSLSTIYKLIYSSTNQIILRFLEIPSVHGKIVKFFFNGEIKAKDSQQKPSTKKAQGPGGPSCACLIVTVSDDLLSHAATNAVPSALRGLTSVVGMETGGPPSL